MFSDVFRRISRLLVGLIVVVATSTVVDAQTQAAGPSPRPGGGIMLSPARVELEVAPGEERTFVVNVDYGAPAQAATTRFLATLSDWTLTRTGEVQLHPAGTQPRSASSWIVYTPAEAAVEPGAVHSIRVTVDVPKDAAPGDHLAAIVVEPRPDDIKFQANTRQMMMRFRMASMFYIKVRDLTALGTLEDLQADAVSEGILVRPLLRNGGNSVVRPIASVTVTDEAGRIVAQLPETETLPVLGGSELSQPLLLEQQLAPGSYSVKYHVNFQGRGASTEGITELVVSAPAQASR